MCDAGRDVVGHQRRHADAEVHVHPVAQLLGGALGDLIAGQRHGIGSGAPLAHGALLDRLLVLGALDDALHEDAGRVHLVGVELARLDQLLDLGDGDLAGRAAIIGLKLRAVLR